VERIWLDWKNRKLIETKWLPVGVEQAANRILSEVQEKTERSV
jgi:hypothetical protein